jgi:S1-C subfamily serine protease
MTTAERDRVIAATVRMQRRRGLGVVVPGRMIGTAAHVIKRHDIWRRDAIGDAHFERVRAHSGRRFLADVYAVEAISDIALLGEPDGQAFFKEHDDYQEIVDAIDPVPVFVDDFPRDERFTVHILTHNKGWVEAQARQVSRHGNVIATAADGIDGGTSGGPVVIDDGRLIGVISTAGGTVGEPEREVTMARFNMLPAPLVRTMLDPEWEVRLVREEIEHLERPL